MSLLLFVILELLRRIGKQYNNEQASSQVIFFHDMSFCISAYYFYLNAEILPLYITVLNNLLYFAFKI